jgi:hypothetical protein
VPTSPTHWQQWHAPYEDPSSYLSRRLAAVQAMLRSALDDQPEGPVQIVSLCAGQGRDLIGVLRDHPRRGDARARLVELDEGNVSFARDLAEAAGLRSVEIVCGDASRSDSFLDAVPAGIVLVCGVFGNIAEADIERTISLLPAFCTPKATVIWTRHRRPPDLTPSVRGWFAEHGFEELDFVEPDDAVFGVGSNRFVGSPRALEPGVRLFDFIGDGHRPA